MYRLFVTVMVTVVATLSFQGNAFGREIQVIVGFHKAPSSAEKAMFERKHGRIKKEFKHIRAITVNIQDGDLPTLLSDPDVAYIEDDVKFQAIDPIVGTPAEPVTTTGNIEYDNAWSVLLIGSITAHTQSITGAGVNIAILDTGIDYTHPDLDMNYSGGDNFISLDANNHDPLDDSYNSHGTHVAGVISAELDGAGVVGVAPDASIYAVKVLDGAGFGSVSSIVAGIDWAIANQMDIVNMSMGITTYSQSLADACEAADAAGILLVAAAGNNYGGAVLYPAAFPSVIAVGATTIYDEISPISPIGPEMELTAPGLNVYSTIAGGSYGFLGGTSQATPHVSGLAALLLSASMADLNGDGVVNGRDVRLLIQNTAVDLGTPGFDDIYGYGRVSVEIAMQGNGADENPINHLTIKKREGPHEITIENGIFDITIVNTSLKAIKVKVFENNQIRRDLSRKFKFNNNHGNGEAPSPQEVSYSLDATETTYKLAFIPKGNNGSLADAYIQKQ
jgi:subtilisin